METTGALSGSRPSSRRLSGVAAQARAGSSMRATARTTIGLAVLISDLPSPGSTVERAAYFTSASDRARAMRTRDNTAAVEPRAAEVQIVSGTRAKTTATPVVHLARSAIASASHITRPAGSTVVASRVAITTRPTTAAARPVKTARRSRDAIDSRY